MPERGRQSIDVDPGTRKARITPNLVREVSQVVYRMLQAELNLDRERDRLREVRNTWSGGGR